jgi:hypothetical protein
MFATAAVTPAACISRRQRLMSRRERRKTVAGSACLDRSSKYPSNARANVRQKPAGSVSPLAAAGICVPIATSPIVLSCLNLHLGAYEFEMERVVSA